MMKKIVGLFVGGLLLLGSVGCNTIPDTTVVKLTSKNATFAGLVASEASVDDAKKVKAVALTVNDLLVNGEIDHEFIQKEVYDLIVKEFSPDQAAVFTSVVGDISNLIVDILKERNDSNLPFDPNEKAVELVIAATDGVVEGVDLYVNIKEPVAEASVNGKTHNFKAKYRYYLENQ